MIQMNLFTEQIEIYRLREQTDGYQGGGSGRGTDWEFRADKCALLYLKQITDKDLLYSTGHCSVLRNNLNGERI